MCRNLLRGCKNDFLEVSLDSHCEDLFLEISIFSSISGDSFVTVASIMAENDIKRFSERGVVHAHRNPLCTPLRTGISE